jgi:hypothetical protein
MNHASRSVTMLLALGLLACRAAPPAPGVTPEARGAVRRAALTVLNGFVRVPARLLAEGGTLLSNGGAGVVSSQGGNVLSNQGATYALRQAAGEAPVPGARVFLADARGQALKGMPDTRTDAAGRFRLERVPPNLTYVVVVEAPTSEGGTARLLGLASSEPGVGEVRVGLGTTLAASVLIDPARGLGSLGRTRFADLATTLEAGLAAAPLPDLVDAASVRRAADALLAADTALSARVGTAREALGTDAVAPEAMMSQVAAALTPAAAGGGEVSSAPSPPPVTTAGSTPPEPPSSGTPTGGPAPPALISTDAPPGGAAPLLTPGAVAPVPAAPTAPALTPPPGLPTAYRVTTLAGSGMSGSYG